MCPDHMKNLRSLKPQMIRFHLNEMFQIGKPIETESGPVAACGGRGLGHDN